MNEIMNVMTIDGIRGYMDGDTPMLNLEDVARGYGVIKRDVKNGVEYTRIHKQNLKRWLISFGLVKSENDPLPDYIPESAFYFIGMKADGETAREFQMKVCVEILPAIRKHGGYIAGEENMTDDELLSAALVLAERKLKEREKRIQALTVENMELKPKAEKHDQLMASEGGVLMKGLAGFLVQNGVMWLTFNDGTKKKNGQNNLYQWMREQGYLCKAKGERYNLPMQKWIDTGLFALKAAVADIGGVKREVTTTIVTPKGQSYFLDLFIKKEAILTVV